LELKWNFSEVTGELEIEGLLTTYTNARGFGILVFDKGGDGGGLLS